MFRMHTADGRTDGVRAAASSPMGPPQSCTTRIGSTSRRASIHAASAAACRSSVCQATARGLELRPQPRRSGASTRSRWPSSAAMTFRQRKLQVGFPWTQTTSRPRPVSTQAIVPPGTLSTPRGVGKLRGEPPRVRSSAKGGDR